MKALQKQKFSQFIHLWGQILPLLDPDPYRQYGSGSRKSNSIRIRIRIQDAKSIRIRRDPDPKHWLKYYQFPLG